MFLEKSQQLFPDKASDMMAYNELSAARGHYFSLLLDSLHNLMQKFSKTLKLFHVKIPVCWLTIVYQHLGETNCP